MDVITWDEIREFQDIYGHLLVTFSDGYSRKERKHREITFVGIA